MNPICIVTNTMRLPNNFFCCISSGLLLSKMPNESVSCIMAAKRNARKTMVSMRRTMMNPTVLSKGR